MKERMNVWMMMMMRISVFFSAFATHSCFICFVLLHDIRYENNTEENIHLTRSFFTHEVGIELDDYCLRDGRNVTIPSRMGTHPDSY